MENTLGRWYFAGARRCSLPLGAARGAVIRRTPGGRGRDGRRCGCARGGRSRPGTACVCSDQLQPRRPRAILLAWARQAGVPVGYTDAPPGWWREFIMASPARTAKLAVVRADGSPHVAPVWADLDGDQVVFMISADSVKGKAILRDPRVSLCWDDERPADDHRAAPGRDHPRVLRQRPLLHREPQRRPRHHACRPGTGPARRVPHPARRRLRHRHTRHPSSGASSTAPAPSTSAATPSRSGSTGAPTHPSCARPPSQPTTQSPGGTVRACTSSSAEPRPKGCPS